MKQKLSWSSILRPTFHRLIWSLVVVSFQLCPQQASAEVHITDDRGKNVVLSQPATRIIALYGAFNEIIAALGDEETIIARTDTDELPPSIVPKPSIGTHMRPNPELIIGLKPDLVIQLAGRDEALEPIRILESHGMTTAVFRMDSFQDLFSAIVRIGELTGHPQRGQELVASMQRDLHAVEALWPKQKPRVFFEARYPNLLAAGRTSITSEIITRAGGMNAVMSSDKLVRLNEEELLRIAPDIYLVQKGPMNPAPQPLSERDHFQSMSCVQAGKVYIVDQQIFSRPGPRSIQAVRELNTLLTRSVQGVQP